MPEFIVFYDATLQFSGSVTITADTEEKAMAALGAEGILDDCFMSLTPDHVSAFVATHADTNDLDETP